MTTSKTMIVRMLCVFFLMACIQNVFGQYTTPGTGVVWDFDDLVTHSGGVVTKSDGVFTVSQNITIAETDKLEVITDITVKLATDVRLFVNGGGASFIINAPNQAVFTAVNPESVFGAWDVLEGSVVHWNRALFEYGKGIRVIESDFVVRNCTFQNMSWTNNTNGAISATRGKITIEKCQFLNNQRAGVTSGTNMGTTWVILDSYFYNNTVDNSNRPQINIGPCQEGDTSKIIGNRVIGVDKDKVGGIGCSSLLSVPTTYIVENNEVRNNRYGITFTGSNVTGKILYNRIIDNNLETNPNLGGSGINITASGGNSHAVITGNLITGNLWGITLVGNTSTYATGPTCNLGNLTPGANYNEGKNVFSNNGNGGILYDLYNNNPHDVMAQNNLWGVAEQTAANIETVIAHKTDDSRYGTVTFMPPYTNPYDPPQALNAILENENDLKLTWTRPNGALPFEIIQYKVYRNNVLLETVDTTLYVDENLSNGTYSYCVKAVYGTFESENICEEVTIGESSDCALPQNLTATLHDPLWYNVHLNWEAPEGSVGPIIIDSVFIATGFYQGTRPISEAASSDYGTIFEKTHPTAPSIADDFVLTEDTYITAMDFYGFLLNSGITNMPFNGIYVRIYDGDPSAGGQVIWGDMNTNLFEETSFTGIYRVINSGRNQTNRPIMLIKANINHLFTAGTYWFEVAATKGVSSTNFVTMVPITIPGTSNTGNAKKCVSNVWSEWTDAGNQGKLGVPFSIYGLEGSNPYISGYQVTRDGVQLAQIPGEQHFYLDTVPEAATYEYGIKAVWSNNCVSPAATTSVVMDPDPCADPISVFPHYEGFENGGIIPDCWRQEYVQKNTAWRFVQGSDAQSPSTVHGGSYKAYFVYNAAGGGNGATTKLISPMLDISNLGNPAVDFWHAQRFGTGNQDLLRVYYKNDPQGDWNMIKEFNSNYPDWAQEIINLPNPTSTYWIAFEGVVASGFGIMLDDIMIQYADRCPVVANLIGTQEPNTNNVRIAWAAPNNGVNINSYTIYKDGVQIASNIQETFFIDENLAAGSYTYGVKIVYDNLCEVSEIEYTSPVQVRDICGNTPRNLTATKNTPGWYNVSLNWDAPVGVEGTWDNHGGDFDNSIGNDGELDFVIASRWYPTDLTNFVGKKLSVVKFVPAEAECSYSVRVWTGVTSSNPGIMVVDQEIPASSITLNTWNEVVLQNAVTIDFSGELWIGIRCNTKTGYPAGADAGPSRGDNYNMIYWGGMWKTLANVIPTSAHRNWCIGACFTEPTSPVILGYNIFRNGIKINEPYMLYPGNSYIDLLPMEGTYTYGISAVHNNSCVSPTIEQTVTVEKHPCEVPLSLPFTYGFEEAFPAQCWQNLSDNSATWERVAQGAYPSCNPHTGSGMLKFNSHFYNAGAIGRLVTPLLPTNYNSCKLSFWIYRDNESATTDRLNVYLHNSADVTGLASLISVHRYTAYAPVTQTLGWNRYEVTFSPKDMDVAYLIFEAVGNHGYCIYIDDITIESLDPVCNPPTALVPTVTESTVALAWTAPAEGTPAGYKVFRNDELQETVTTTTFTQENVENGTYNYCVKAVYEACESEEVCASVEVNVAIPTYTITATAGENGSIDPEGEITVNEGDNQTFTFTADNGYEVDQLLVDNVNVADSIAGGSYTFKNVTEDHIIAVTFKLIPIPTYTITATAGENGSIDPEGEITVNEGDNQTFTITPNEGYKIAQVLVDGVNNTEAVASGSYTFTDVTAVHTIEATFEQRTYTITATAGENGSIDPEGEITVNEGDNQTFTITADNGYEVDQLLVDNVNIADSIAGGSYTFKNVTEDHIIAVTFKLIPIPTYTITATAGENGSIDPEGAITVNEGDNQTFTITADNGYEVDQLLVDNVNIADSIAGGSYTFKNVTEDHIIAVTFKLIPIPTYTITATAGENGSIDPEGAITVNEGDNQTFTITADNGYEVDQLLVDNVNIADSIAGGSYTFKNVTEDHIIAVTFKLIPIPTYTITATAGENGSIDPEGEITVTEGDDQTFTITPNEGYKIAQVLVDGVNNTEAVASGSYTFTDVTAVHTIEATFEQRTYTITATAGENGSITPSGNIVVNHGDDQTFTITPNEGYKIAQVLVDGVNNTEAVASGSYTFTNVTAAHTIEATFEQRTYIITATAGENGTVDPDGNVIVNYGDDQTFTITPNEGYKIAQVLVDGVNNATAVSSGSFTFTDVMAAHTIEATFKSIDESSFTLTVNYGSGGKVSPNGIIKVEEGENKTFTIMPNNGYKINQVLIDGVNDEDAVASGVYTFEDVTDDHSLVATFTYISGQQYFITASSGTTGGVISPNGKVTVMGGDDYMFTITPNAGYKIKEVLVDGVNNIQAVQDGYYIFENISASHTIVAKYEKQSFTIMASVDGIGGTITPAGATIITYNGSKAYNIASQTGYMISEVLIDGVNDEKAVSSGKYTFKNVMENHTIVVSFKPRTYEITATAGDGGTIAPEGISTITYGSSVTYDIVADAGYKIKAVMVDGKNNSAAVNSGVYTFSNVTAKHTIAVTFTAIPNAPMAIGDDNQEITLKVYPNPTTGKITIKSTSLARRPGGAVSVFDITGRLVLEVNNIDHNETKIDLSNYADGVYFIRVDGKTVKIVKR